MSPHSIRWITACALSVVVSGCTIPGDSSLPNGRSSATSKIFCGAELAAEGPGRGDAASHGTPTREDSEVTVSLDGSSYRATQVVSLANDFGGAQLSTVNLDTVNGDITPCLRKGGGYRINALLEGRGSTEAQARQALAGLSVSHADTLTSGQLKLNTQVNFDRSGLENIEVLGLQQQSASLIAGLPAPVDYALDARTVNGKITASGFSGVQAKLSTINGSLQLDGDWSDATLNNSSGNISVDGDFTALSADSTNGSLMARIGSSRSASLSLSSTNGSINAQLLRQSADLDLMGSTTNGNVRIEISNAQPVGEQKSNAAHFRTPGYEANALKVELDARSTNGDIHIHE